MAIHVVNKFQQLSGLRKNVWPKVLVVYIEGRQVVGDLSLRTAKYSYQVPKSPAGRNSPSVLSCSLCIESFCNMVQSTARKVFPERTVEEIIRTATSSPSISGLSKATLQTNGNHLRIEQIQSPMMLLQHFLETLRDVPLLPAAALVLKS